MISSPGPFHELKWMVPVIDVRVYKVTPQITMPRIIILRVRAFFHKTVRVCHVYCNFKIGFTCRITVIFGTLKDGSLWINTLASNIWFSYRNIVQNGVDALPKIVDAFLSKSSNFHLVQIIRQCSNFVSLWHKHLLRGDYTLLLSNFEVGITFKRIY